MAITKTEKINMITVHYHDGVDPRVEITSTVSWDDPDDQDLPITKNEHRVIEKTTISTTWDSETGEPTHTESPTDYSGESAHTVAICDTVWS